MNFLSKILLRFRWIHFPGAVLFALLQRTPALRVAISAENAFAAPTLGAVLRAAFTGLASLGAVHTLAGPTTFIVQQGNARIYESPEFGPPRINLPATGTVGTGITSVAFTVVEAPTPAGSYEVKNLPPGLSVPGANSSGVVNPSPFNPTGSIIGTPTTPGTYSVLITAYEFPGGTTQQGNSSIGPITVTFNIAGGVSVAPTFDVQPLGQTVAPGGSITLTATAKGSPPPTYQWRKNGVAIVGATNATLALTNAQSIDSGDYTVVATNAGGAVTSNVATILVASIDPNARLTNLSVRTAMAAGQMLIVGVVVDGGARDVLVRAAGPALAAFGLSAAMTDPQLELFNGSTSVFQNNDWPATLAPMFASVGAFAFAANSKDAAFVQTISGARSIQARGTGAGVVLVEAYDTGPTTAARLVNVSARNRVGTGDDILIAGFNISGAAGKQLLIRAVGPKLGAFGVTGFLADPKLEVYSGTTKLVENDNWTPDLAATFTAVGAFSLDAGSRDAALRTTLQPGSYTAQVSGVNGGTGEALIEIYEVP